ncbi:HD domain-containing protein [Cystobacter fuscus]
MHTKAAPSIALLRGRRTLPLLEAYFELHHLKHLYRQGWLRVGIPRDTCESVAEHSFFLALLCLFLADSCFPEADASKLVRMALLCSATTTPPQQRQLHLPILSDGSRR